jgi:hypothetical protein
MKRAPRLPLDVIDDGHDCPECGCRASDVIQRREAPMRVFRGGRPVSECVMVTEVRACEHCENEYAIQFERGSLEDPAAQGRGVDGVRTKVRYGVGAVQVPGATCPQCGRFPVKVTGSGPKVGRGEARVRNHKCECGWRGQSVE